MSHRRSAALFLALGIVALAVAVLSANGPVEASELPVAPGLVLVADDDQCSLIEAIDNANAPGTHDVSECAAGSEGKDTIALANATYELTQVDNTNFGANGLPSITSNITIEGNGATIQRAQEAPPFRILHVTPTGELTLQRVFLTGGLALGTDGGPGEDGGPGQGGAILNQGGRLRVIMSTLAYNEVRGGRGGDSPDAAGGNGGNGEGGAIDTLWEPSGVSFTTTENATFSGNIAAGGLAGDGTTDGIAGKGRGGAIFIADNASTISLYSTFVDNQADHGTTYWTYPNNAIRFEYDLIVGDDNACYYQCADFTPEQAAVLPLALNPPGLTPTHALLGTSIAIDLDYCADGAFTDQRGFVRPYHEDCDYGAYEYEHPATPTPTLPPTPTPTPSFPEVGTVAIDLDTTGNTARHIGVGWAGIDAGDIQSSLTLPIGATTGVDIVVDSVPEPGLYGVGFDFNYDPAVLQVTSIDASDVLQYANQDPTPYHFTDPLPDADGKFRVDSVDFSPTYEVGAGRVYRLQVTCIAEGASSLSLSDGTTDGGRHPGILNGVESRAYRVGEDLGAVITCGNATFPPATEAPTDTAEPTTAPSSTPTATAQMQSSDLNCDSHIDATDALPILTHLAQIPPNHPSCPTVGQPASGNTLWGDLDCDQAVDLDDVLLALDSILTGIPSPACG